MKSKELLMDVIKLSRTYVNKTLRELEEETKISYSQLSKIERGESIPSKENIELLAKALNLDKNHLLVLCGYTPTEISIGTAELIYELWGDDEDSTTNISSEDIILIRNQMAHGAIQAKIPDRVPIEMSEDMDRDWAKFIKDMKKRNITPHQLRDILAFAVNINKYVENISFLKENK
ncbi:helix-turn-helix transcriptional regulator [Paenibacillus sp. HB172176]|uniref:helix-turn-helix domain-containing protein n=1 Tax=Paenibacillus sp. HB172176 TaxID=2493690 RepID=UPI001981EE74|nr:helix-turn-helix transcriptional regulator [Paenibacillus sp. HB172176]